jgi:hypothetical protein
MAEYYAQFRSDVGKFQAFGPYVTLKGAEIAAKKIVNGKDWREVPSPDVVKLWKHKDGHEVQIVGSE